MVIGIENLQSSCKDNLLKNNAHAEYALFSKDYTDDIFYSHSD